MPVARRWATAARLRPARRVGAAALRRLPLEVWARLHTGDRLRVLLSSTVGRSVWLRGVYESEVESVLGASLRPGDTFIDVGADCGYFSTIAARLVGPAGSVHAFEPAPASRRRLERAAIANRHHNITVVGAAVWSESTVVALANVRDPAFGFVQQRGAGTPVDAISLDAYAADGGVGPVRAMKIDVEGAELEVLTGARSLLARDHPLVVVEAQDWSLRRFGASLDDLFGFAVSVGYTVETLHGVPLATAGAARAALERAPVPNVVLRFSDRRAGGPTTDPDPSARSAR